MRTYQSANGEWITTDDQGRKYRAATPEAAESAFMADQLKLNAVAELRDLTAQSTALFDQINVWLIKNNRFGYLPDSADTKPDDPITDDDVQAEPGTVEQLYAVAMFFGGLVQSVNPQTAKLLARFGKKR